MSKYFDHINNLKLIENNLNHIVFEIGNESPSYFRIARECHQVLYRAMVESLKGSANLSITGRRRNKSKSVNYFFGDLPYKEIHKRKVKNCKKAWRYSKPKETEPTDERENDIINTKSSDFLLGFYDLLAMIQTECYMNRFIHSKSVHLVNREMRIIEWLHEYIRNEYEHFIPKSYSAFILDLIEASLICCKLTKKLIYKSGNILYTFIPKNLNKNIAIVLSNLYKKRRETLVELEKDGYNRESIK